MHLSRTFRFFFKNEYCFSNKTLFRKLRPGLSPPAVFHVSVGDFVFKIVSHETEASEYISGAYKNFFSSESLPDYVVRIYSNNYEDVFNVSESEDEDYFYGVKQFKDYFYFRHSKEKNEVDVILPKQYEQEALDNFFRMILSSRSLNKKIALFHCSVIVKDGKFIFFLGKSGAGKSTIAGLSGHRVIHDDLATVSFEENRNVRVSTIPFKPRFEKVSVTGEIDCVYQIFQSETTFVEEMTSVEAFSILVQSLWSLNEMPGNASDHTDHRHLDFCNRLLKYAKVKKLYFRKNTDFVNII